jgi:hypothetical protein
MIYIERRGPKYWGYCEPPTSPGFFGFGERRSRADLTAEFIKAGVPREIVAQAFEFADAEAELRPIKTSANSNW